jgi:hypothetical protein
MFYFSTKEQEEGQEQKPALDENVTPLDSQYMRDSIRAAFETARVQAVDENIAFFVSTARHIIDILNSQEGLTATLVSYHLKKNRYAPLDADLSAYGGKVNKYRALGYSGIYGTRCLQLSIDLQHDEANILLKTVIGKIPDNLYMQLWLIDDGKGHVKYAEDVDQYNDPNDSLDPFSTLAENAIIKKAEENLCNFIASTIQKAKQHEALGVARTTVLPHKPHRKVTLK